MSRLRAFITQASGTLVIAFTTAVMTLVLLVVLSVVLGGENVRHRESSRCQSALIVSMLRDAFRNNPVNQDLLDRYPEINLDGIDCTPYLTEPLDHNTP